MHRVQLRPVCGCNAKHEATMATVTMLRSCMENLVSGWMKWIRDITRAARICIPRRHRHRTEASHWH
jgi:hypothetical protein